MKRKDNETKNFNMVENSQSKSRQSKLRQEININLPRLCSKHVTENDEDDVDANSQSTSHRRQSKLRQEIDRNISRLSTNINSDNDNVVASSKSVIKNLKDQPRRKLKDTLPVEKLSEVMDESSESDDNFLKAHSKPTKNSKKIYTNLNLFNKKNVEAEKKLKDTSLVPKNDLSQVHLQKLKTLRVILIQQVTSQKVHSNLNLFDQKNVEEEKKLKNISPVPTNDLSLENLQKLKKLRIILKHKVPPQHKDPRIPSYKFLSPKEASIFESYGPLKKTSYNKNEDGIIKRNWRNFCKLHNWNVNIVEPFFYMRHGKKYYISSAEERKNFFRFLANGLPRRTLKSVHNRFKNLYSNSIKQGTYSHEDDQIILSHMENNKESDGNKCAKLAQILNRKRHSIWQRYQILKKRNSGDTCKDSNDDFTEQKKGVKRKRKCLDIDNDCGKDCELNNTKLKSNENSDDAKKDDQVVWNLETVKKFIDCLIDTTSTKEISDLNHKVFDKQVWSEMKKRLNIDSKRLKTFWYLQLQRRLFCPAVSHLNDIKLKIMTLLYEKKFSMDPQWKDATPIPLNDWVNPLFLTQLTDKIFQDLQSVVSSEDKNIVEHLHYHLSSELKLNSMDFILPKSFYTYDWAAWTTSKSKTLEK